MAQICVSCVAVLLACLMFSAVGDFLYVFDLRDKIIIWSCVLALLSAACLIAYRKVTYDNSLSRYRKTVMSVIGSFSVALWAYVISQFCRRTAIIIIILVICYGIVHVLIHIRANRRVMRNR